MNDKRPLLIVFEGTDKSGKTTLLNELNKATNFKYVVLDRFTTSSKVYNHFFERNFYEYYDEVEDRIIEDFEVIVFFCICSTEKLEERLRNANEKLPEQLRNIQKVNYKFVTELICSKMKNELHFQVKVIDTDKTIEESMTEILSFIREIEEKLDADDSI